MRHLPRFALGTVQPGCCRKAALFGLVAALDRMQVSPVLFRASCEFAPHDPGQAVLGRASRHLDSWAMSRSDAISALARGTRPHDTAIVEGAFDSSASTSFAAGNSSLLRLCEWLDLPRVAVIDVQRLATRGIDLPPQRMDALFLDRVRDPRDAAYWQTTLEALWKTPVIGWLDEVTPLRAMIDALPMGQNPSLDLCNTLADRLLPTLRPQVLGQILSRSAPLSFEPEGWLLRDRPDFRIAVAMDEIYTGCYPESFDLLEAAGAELCDFSPLRSESIPDHADVVYIGCGHPDREPAKLAANHCLKQSLRCFAAAGGRIYAEGAGLAYLCREILLPSGQSIAMTGLLPARARCLPTATAEAAEITFGASSWIAPAGVTIRGYRHTGWEIDPRGPMMSYAAGETQRLDLLGRGSVIGSRVLINLAANRHLLRRFFEPFAVASARQ